MAIAVNGGHVSRALDFYDKESKYLIVGGTDEWSGGSESPETPLVVDFKLNDVVGLKKITKQYLVIPVEASESKDNEIYIDYRDQRWRAVPRSISTTTTSSVSKNSKEITVASTEGLKAGYKVRIMNNYESIIESISGTTLTLITGAPVDIPSGSEVLGGALVEGAKYVYIEAYLNYGEFPLVTYRQVGVCTKVVPAVGVTNVDILRAAAYNSATGTDEFSSLGILEILDNRAPITRDSSMREQISMIVEF